MYPKNAQINIINFSSIFQNVCSRSGSFQSQAHFPPMDCVDVNQRPANFCFDGSYAFGAFWNDVHIGLLAWKFQKFPHLCCLLNTNWICGTFWHRVSEFTSTFFQVLRRQNAQKSNRFVITNLIKFANFI